eukprot:Rhum_TRINITY_DN12328_c0_g1::Rhum_TRINITY_DN12328_c0_g1_i1::g.51199::m.51199
MSPVVIGCLDLHAFPFPHPRLRGVGLETLSGAQAPRRRIQGNLRGTLPQPLQLFFTEVGAECDEEPPQRRAVRHLHPLDVLSGDVRRPLQRQGVQVRVGTQEAGVAVLGALVVGLGPRRLHDALLVEEAKHAQEPAAVAGGCEENGVVDDSHRALRDEDDCLLEVALDAEEAAQLRRFRRLHVAQAQHGEERQLVEVHEQVFAEDAHGCGCRLARRLACSTCFSAFLFLALPFFVLLPFDVHLVPRPTVEHPQGVVRGRERRRGEGCEGGQAGRRHLLQVRDLKHAQQLPREHRCVLLVAALHSDALAAEALVAVAGAQTDGLRLRAQLVRAVERAQEWSDRGEEGVTLRRLFLVGGERMQARAVLAFEPTQVRQHAQALRKVLGVVADGVQPEGAQRVQRQVEVAEELTHLVGGFAVGLDGAHLQGSQRVRRVVAAQRDGAVLLVRDVVGVPHHKLLQLRSPVEQERRAERRVLKPLVSAHVVEEVLLPPAGLVLRAGDFYVVKVLVVAAVARRGVGQRRVHVVVDVPALLPSLRVRLPELPAALVAAQVRVEELVHRAEVLQTSQAAQGVLVREVVAAVVLHVQALNRRRVGAPRSVHRCVLCLSDSRKEEGRTVRPHGSSPLPQQAVEVLVASRAEQGIEEVQLHQALHTHKLDDRALRRRERGTRHVCHSNPQQRTLLLLHLALHLQLVGGNARKLLRRASLLRGLLVGFRRCDVGGSCRSHSGLLRLPLERHDEEHVGHHTLLVALRLLACRDGRAHRQRFKRVERQIRDLQLLRRLRRLLRVLSCRTVGEHGRQHGCKQLSLEQTLHVSLGVHRLRAQRNALPPFSTTTPTTGEKGVNDAGVHPALGILLLLQPHGRSVAVSAHHGVHHAVCRHNVLEALPACRLGVACGYQEAVRRRQQVPHLVVHAQRTESAAERLAAHSQPRPQERHRLLLHLLREAEGGLKSVGRAGQTGAVQPDVSADSDPCGLRRVNEVGEGVGEVGKQRRVLCVVRVVREAARERLRGARGEASVLAGLRLDHEGSGGTKVVH